MKLANQPMKDSPVEERRKELPKGDGNWPGYDSVYSRISKAAEKMGMSKYHCCGENHVKTMAILGCGHEETMKAHLHWLYTYNWLD